MFASMIMVPNSVKLYFEIRVTKPVRCRIEIKSGRLRDSYILNIQKKKSVFVARATTGLGELKFSASVPLTLVVHPQQKRRSIGIKLLELSDDFRRKYGALWPEIKTDSGLHIREITPGRFMRSAYSQSERLLFHRLKLTTWRKSSLEEDGMPPFSVFSENTLHDLLTSISNSHPPEFIFGGDATKFSPENRDLVQHFVTEQFGDPMSASGPAWDFMRQNPGLGMLYWSGEAEIQPKLRHSRMLRRLASVLDIDLPSLATSINLPPLFLIRSEALSWISAFNIEAGDIKSGLRDAQALQRVLPALIQKAGYTIGSIPDFKEVEKLGKPVEMAKWVSFRPPVNVEGGDICLFVGLLNAQNCFAEHALIYMQALRRLGFLVYALGVSLSDPDLARDPGPQYSDAFAARANDGHDFGLWAAALKRTPEIWLAKSLLLANDSMFPSLVGFTELFEKLKKSKFDVSGLTESEIGHRHIQSFFVHMNRAALQTPEVKMFWDAVLSWKDKNRIIALYEIGMTSKVAATSLRCGVIFDIHKDRSSSKFNPTIHGWKELIENGFPFVKTQVLRELVNSASGQDDLSFLERKGFSRKIITREFQK